MTIAHTKWLGLASSRAILLCCASLIIIDAGATGGYAQSVRGVVVHDETGTPIAEAELTLLRANGQAVSRTLSDSAGSFTFATPGAGEYAIRFEQLGFEAQLSATFRIDAGTVQQIELRVTHSPISVNALRAVGTSRQTEFDRRRLSSVSGRFITREQIDRRRSGRTSDLLREVPGVSIVADPSGRQSGLIRMRGGRSGCDPAIFVNGVPMRQYAESTIDDMVQLGTLEGIEVYASSASVPAEFAQFGTCGAVAFWLRNDDKRGRPFSLKRTLIALGMLAGMLVITR